MFPLVLILGLCVLATRIKPRAPALTGASGGGSEVSPKLTPASPAEVLGAILAAASKLGVTLGHQGAAMLAGQAAMETGAFKKLYNFNLGNITHNHGDGYDYNHRPEVPDPKMVYRVYGSLLEGAEDLLHWGIKRGALPALQAGSVAAYEDVLQHNCYLGCDASQQAYDNYAAAIASYAHQYAALVPIYPSSSSPWLAALALGGLAGALYLSSHPERVGQFGSWVADKTSGIGRTVAAGARKTQEKITARLHSATAPAPAPLVSPDLFALPSPPPSPSPSPAPAPAPVPAPAPAPFAVAAPVPVPAPVTSTPTPTSTSTTPTQSATPTPAPSPSSWSSHTELAGAALARPKGIAPRARARVIARDVPAREVELEDDDDSPYYEERI